MDHFGIGAAMETMVHTYLSASRQKGRTTSLVDSVKDGDRIITHSEPEALRLTRLCAERGIKVQCVAIDPHSPTKLYDLGTSPNEGRTLFDHAWVEMYYLKAVKQAGADIDMFQQRLSGYGAAHRETKRKYQEAVNFTPGKWAAGLGDD